MKEYKAILARNVVSDDTIERIEGGYYKGHNKSNVCVTYNLFANEWSDNAYVKFFKSVDAAIDWYKKKFAVRAIEFQRTELGEEANDFSDSDILDDWEDTIKLVLEV